MTATSSTSAKKIVITGASDGIGAEAARQLAAKGHDVVIVGRSATKTEAVARELNAPFHLADFAELAQVRRLAEELRRDHADLDVLINNAGGVFGDETPTVDGFERTHQINHLAHFLLTNLLIEPLRANRASVINTSSMANRMWGALDLDDLDNATDYSANKAYGDAKRANILFTRELHAREHANGISTAALHPGAIATSFASDTTSFMRFVYGTPLRHLFLKSPKRGADNTVWLAEGTPGTDWESGAFYVKRSVGQPHPQTQDPYVAQQLWERSAQRVALLP